MPRVGDITTGRKLGKKNGRQYIWLPCAKCKIERWVSKEYFDKRGYDILCQACHNKELGERQKGKLKKPGGTFRTPHGYIVTRLASNDFFFPMANAKGYVFMHRLVMAKHLGRCLLPFPIEIVHHKDGNRANYNRDNLELASGIGGHNLTHRKGYQDGYLQGMENGRSKQVKELKQRVRLLEEELTKCRSKQAII